MSDLMAEMSKLLAVVMRADNQAEVNTELTKLREEMTQIHRQIDAEKTRMTDRQAQSTKRRSV